jgi:F-type H+-transporting ATPase subunit alpha
VAGKLRLDLAQFRELEAFAQFGSELDEKTRMQIERGKRTVEILKQNQYAPMSVEHQVATLYALVNGYLDDVPVEKIVRWEWDFNNYLNVRGQEMLKLIGSEKELNEQVEEALKQKILEFKENYVTA